MPAVRNSSGSSVGSIQRVGTIPVGPKNSPYRSPKKAAASPPATRNGHRRLKGASRALRVRASPTPSSASMSPCPTSPNIIPNMRTNDTAANGVGSTSRSAAHRTCPRGTERTGEPAVLQKRRRLDPGRLRQLDEACTHCGQTRVERFQLLRRGPAHEGRVRPVANGASCPTLELHLAGQEVPAPTALELGGLRSRRGEARFGTAVGHRPTLEPAQRLESRSFRGGDVARQLDRARIGNHGEGVAERGARGDDRHPAHRCGPGRLTRSHRAPPPRHQVHGPPLRAPPRHGGRRRPGAQPPR